MNYKKLIIRSYARSASNFIMYNSMSIVPSLEIIKDHWSNLEKSLDNQVVVTVLRNPFQAIVSDIAMSISDTYSGINELSQIDYKTSIFNFTEYINKINQNIEHIIPFTFEQLTINPKQSFKLFLNKCGFEDEFKFPNVAIKEKKVVNQLMNKKQVFLPSSKTLDSYGDINNYFINNDEFAHLLETYEHCKKNIYLRQLDF